MQWGIISDRIGRKVRLMLQMGWHLMQSSCCSEGFPRKATPVTKKYLSVSPAQLPSLLQPVMVIGNLACVVSTVLFGLSGTYWQAVAARALGGTFNAIILVEKAMLGGCPFGPAVSAAMAVDSMPCLLVSCVACIWKELVVSSLGRPPSCLVAVMCIAGQAISTGVTPGSMTRVCIPCSSAGEGLPDKASQAKGFGLLGLCWGIGSLAGPMVGGALSAPCSSALRWEPLCGQGSLLVHR
jgi:MFS family permease